MDLPRVLPGLVPVAPTGSGHPVGLLLLPQVRVLDPCPSLVNAHDTIMGCLVASGLCHVTSREGAKQMLLCPRT